MKWIKGRQQTGYDKCQLAGGLWPIPFDMYLLRFPTGTKIPPHVDKVEFGRHFRLNIVVKKSKDGGEFKCNNTLFRFGRVALFRSDEEEHSVSEITSGTRYVLSIGWILK